MAEQISKGTYENGAIRLDDPPPAVTSARVLVTFLGSSIALVDAGIAPAQAADLGARLAPFAEDWNRAEMDAYDAL